MSSLIEIVDVGGADERQAEFFAQFDDPLVDDLLLGDRRVMLQFEEIVPLAEDPAIHRRDPLRLVVVLGDQRARHLGGEAGREADQPFGIFAQDLVIDTRLVIEALGVREADELDQVLVADLILRQEDEVVVLGVGLAALRAHPARRDIRLDADDRLHPRLVRRLVEVDRAVERAVIGEGDRRPSRTRCARFI